ncbi:hypothetical protein BST61_g11217 [Cercospora zeina]
MLRNGYGQSEACGMNSTAVLQSDMKSFRSIGRHSWLNYWIVDPGDHDRLMPVGGDLNGRKWYKTGGLVQYQHNGDVHLYGRKDSQLKVNGQRVEAADIETHVANAFREEIEQVVVDQVGAEQARKLVAFIKLRAGKENCTADELRTEVHARLKPLVPSWMMPSHVVLVSVMPRTATGKLSRRTLREGCANELNQSEELEDTAFAFETKPEVSMNGRTDAIVTHLVSLCRRVLHIDEKHVPSTSNWTTLGGDSLNAMKLVKQARDSGIHLTTADLMMGKSLAELCTSGSKTPPLPHVHDARPTSLEKALPLTDFQAHYMAPGQGSDRGDLYKYQLLFRGKFDLPKLHEAIHLWFNQLEALRLSFTSDASGQPIQSVIEPGQATWRSRIILKGENQAVDDLAAQFDFFTDPVLAVLHGSDESALGDACVTLYINHCIFDGTSVNHMFHDLVTCYEKSSVSSRPSFLQYLDRRLLERNDSSLVYWKYLLQDSTPTVLRSAMEDRQADVGDCSIRTVSRVSFLANRQRTNASISTLVYSAWSLVLSVLAGRSDVVFLYLVHGRDEHVEGSDAIVGLSQKDAKPTDERHQKSGRMQYVSSNSTSTSSNRTPTAPPSLHSWSESLFFNAESGRFHCTCMINK